jgi:hypothetical protein
MQTYRGHAVSRRHRVTVEPQPMATSIRTPAGTATGTPANNLRLWCVLFRLLFPVL